MGLDMYLFRMEKLSDNELGLLEGKRNSELPKNLLLFNKKHVDEDESGMCDDLKPYFSEITTIQENYDLDSIKSANGIPQDAFLDYRGGSKDSLTLGFSWNEDGESKSGRVQIGANEYVVSCAEASYIVRCEEVFYWRKAYDACNTIEELYGKPMNSLGYYHLSPEILCAMRDEGCFQGRDFPYLFNEDIFFLYWA